MPTAAAKIGVISDTHGLLRPEAVARLRGCDAIVHAGDIGRLEVLHDLAGLAPRLIAIRGNVDLGWAGDLPDAVTFEIAGRRIYVLHDVKSLSIDPEADGIDVVIAGHSHQPRVERRGGVLYLNPGSAGPRRFRLPVTLARLSIRPGRLDARIVGLV